MDPILGSGDRVCVCVCVCVYGLLGQRRCILERFLSRRRLSFVCAALAINTVITGRRVGRSVCVCVCLCACVWPLCVLGQPARGGALQGPPPSNKQPRGVLQLLWEGALATPLTLAPLHAGKVHTGRQAAATARPHPTRMRSPRA